ncbi:HNH endonuclease signature motif containing protein [Mycobacterium kyogaense]|uniref:HNH endonuclease signature motif containing protein n=1 Tax=Mycobacterium kyogaense TaxID=2212479 RepID=UPI001F0952F6|nr:HNH endonuclease signature motif containing protein [Mycobacterium kyogaense]
MFEHMFADVADEALVGAIEQAAVEEGQACARRLAAIAELTRRSVGDDDDRARWTFDLWALTAARIGAALTIGQRRASSQMRIAMALRDRLPRVAELFCQGRISIRVISELTWRTHLVDDDRVLAEIDAALAERAVSWGALSEEKLTGAVNALIERYDPDAVRLAKDVVQERDFKVGAHEDGAETMSAWGRLMAADGIAAERRIIAMINGVCENDPRSVGERRSDAAGALLNGRQHLPCRCGSPACPKADAPAPASHVVVHVIADQAAVDAATKEDSPQHSASPQQAAGEQSDVGLDATVDAATKPALTEQASGKSGAAEFDESVDVGLDATVDAATKPASTEQAPRKSGAAEFDESVDVGLDATVDAATKPASEEQASGKPAAAEFDESVDHARESETDCAPRSLSDTGVALLPGLKVMPAVALADAISGGAKVRPLWIPGPDPEPNYRPSARLAQFIRLRDMFCRFPGCDVPADRCDIDHCVPWPYGPTHPSNLNCKCRTHHLMKTFCFGPDGWTEVQTADGAVTFTAPGGRTHTTNPGSTLFFPQFPAATAELPPPPPVPPDDAARTAKMPTRRRPRSAEVAARVKAERAQNRKIRAAMATPRYGSEGQPPF